MDRFGLLASVVVLALSAAAWGAEAPAAPYRQEQFILSFWGDPPVDNLVAARYAKVDEAHFNIVLGGMGADNPNKARQQRDACKRYNLKVIFSTYGLPIDQLCNCETTYGFLVRDHPAVADFPALRARVDEIRRLRPGKLPFVNLFPMTAAATEMGVDNYADYVAKFIDAIHPDVLCFDYYPSFPPESDGRAAFRENLACIRTAALDHEIPFWCFVKAMACGSDAVPTEAQIRWQVYTALAHGAKGILYSCYATPPAGKVFRGSGLIDADGKETDRYAQVARLNQELIPLGRALMRMKSTSVQTIAPGQPAPAGLPVAVTSNGEILIGAFVREEGGSAMMIVNDRDGGANAVVSLTGARIMEVSKSSGNAEAVKDEDPAGEGLQVTFAPGEGRLFVID